jgi:hypothetical protein
MDAKEKAQQLVDQVIKREEKAKDSGEALIDKIFKEDNNKLKINPIVEELLLKDPKRLEELRNLLLKAEKRELADNAQKAVKIKAAFVKKIHELAEDNNLEELDAEISVYQDKLKITDTVETVDGLLEPITEEAVIEELQGLSASVETGYTLNENIKIAFPAGAITAVVAPTGHGKTRALINFSLGVLKENPNKSVYFFTYEENRAAILTLFLNTYIGEDLSKNNRASIKHYFKNQKVDPFKYFIKDKSIPISEGVTQPLSKYFEAKKNQFFAEILSPGRLNIIYCEHDIENLLQIIQELKAKKEDLGLICIDYIQLLSDRSGKTAFFSRQEELKSICLKMKNCAIKTGLPLVVAAQFNREVQRKEQMHPTKIGEAGDIERIANLIIGIFDIREERQLYIEILKGREIGAGHRAKFGYNGNTGKIEDAEHSIFEGI